MTKKRQKQGQQQLEIKQTDLSKEKVDVGVVKDPQPLEILQHNPINKEFNEKLCKQIVYANPLIDLKDKEAVQQNLDMVTDTLNRMNPQDAIEAMINSQIIAMHNATMALSTVGALASVGGSLKGEFINHSAKISKTFVSLVEALNRHRHRDKVYQNLTVGHVDVHHGGQAIVGNVSTTPKKTDNH